MSKIEELGNFGEYWETVLTKDGLHVLVGLRAQWHNITVVGANKGGEYALAYSMLRCEYPGHYEVSEDTLVAVLKRCANYSPIPIAKYDISQESSAHRLVIKKDHPGAILKTNLWFSDVVSSIRQNDRAYYAYIKQYYSLMVHHGLTNDQATAIVIHNYGLFYNGYQLLPELITLIAQPENAKALTLIIKGTGNNASRIGSMMCELNTLLGRGVKPVNWDDDIAKRFKPKSVQDTVGLGFSKVYQLTTELLTSEIGNRDVVYSDFTQFWNKRWQWSVNGAHTSRLGKEHAEYDFSKTLGKRIYRKAFMENVRTFNPDKWNATTYVTTSEKLEHGKSRALYACDTITYIMFEHLIKPVEQAWHNKSVMLNPGKYSQIGMVDEISRKCVGKPYSLMLDYEDFNSQHTLEDMQAVIEAVMDYTGYKFTWRRKLTESLGKQRLYHKGQYIGTIEATLTSGHRITSFVNSILNKVYMMDTVDGLKDMVTWHTGDDILIRTETIEECEKVLTQINTSRIRINPLKQSAGSLVSEFLRVASNDRRAYGYLARSVASFVSGSWENEIRLSPIEALSTFRQNLWTLRNRASGVRFTSLVLTSAQRLFNTIPIANETLYSILNLTCSLNNSPIIGRSGTITTYYIKEMVPKQSNKYTNRTAYATKDYLTHNLNDVEVSILRQLDLNPQDLMKDASYAKTLTNINEVSPVDTYIIRRSCYSIRDLYIPAGYREYIRRGGVMQAYPILMLYRQLIDTDILEEILETHDIVVERKYIDAVAYGEWNRPTEVVGYIPYCDVRLYQLSHFGCGFMDPKYQYKI